MLEVWLRALEQFAHSTKDIGQQSLNTTRMTFLLVGLIHNNYCTKDEDIELQEPCFLANTVAHEIGHVIGLQHDFNYYQGNRVATPPKQSQGKDCTNVGAIMDYFQAKEKFNFRNSHSFP